MQFLYSGVWTHHDKYQLAEVNVQFLKFCILSGLAELGMFQKLHI